MDTLRILPLACGGSRMKHVITLLTLLLAGPSLATSRAQAQADIPLGSLG
jgi:hypothetical protein